MLGVGQGKRLRGIYRLERAQHLRGDRERSGFGVHCTSTGESAGSSPSGHVHGLSEHPNRARSPSKPSCPRTAAAYGDGDDDLRLALARMLGLPIAPQPAAASRPGRSRRRPRPLRRRAGRPSAQADHRSARAHATIAPATTPASIATNATLHRSRHSGDCAPASPPTARPRAVSQRYQVSPGGRFERIGIGRPSTARGGCWRVVVSRRLTGMGVGVLSLKTRASSRTLPPTFTREAVSSA